MLITPLPVGFGAEVSEFDLRHDRKPEDVARLQQAYIDRDLLVFRGAGQITPERQLEITGWFGPVIVEGAAWTVLDNAEPAGRFVLPFHSDITFVEFPLAGISLCPEELPAGSTSTTYISNALAWQELPEALQRELRGLKARHYFASSDDIDLGLPAFEYWHPVCMPHPKTGRPLLFVTEHHVDRIEGMTEERGADVLKALFAKLYAPERRYEHIWREGDLVIWNNLAIQHARTRVAELSRGRRVMRRVQLGKVSFLEQVARLRRQQAKPCPT
jgi:alpha-ketoglutarate-dependent taurine dioxygenase